VLDLKRVSIWASFSSEYKTKGGAGINTIKGVKKIIFLWVKFSFEARLAI
jgi:hypothetical protein